VNNYKWGMSIAGQDIMYGEGAPARPVSSLSPVCRFEVVAEGFGCNGAKCTRVDDMPVAISQLVQSMPSANGAGRPGLVSLIVDTEPITVTTKSMVGKPEPGKGDNVIVVPYYDNIDRPYYKDE
jgi:thiamine pyrophosphate-dependent acetolactate synthase large subunit-like protein